MRDESSVGRDVAVIVAAGVVLGLLYNGVGMATRPPRGIPWLASATAPPTLESLTPAESVSTAPSQVAVPEPMSPGVAPAGSTPSPSAHATPRSSAPAEPRPTTTAPAGSATAEVRPSTPLPFIPASDQPIQAQIATVKRFFDARAALFVDARDPAEYDAGHIPGAVRLTNPEAQGEPDRVKSLPVQGRPIITYCEGGTCEASLELARTLIEAGHRKVLVYMGGYPEWSAAGYPVERGSGK